jgi:hypothetical protein
LPLTWTYRDIQGHIYWNYGQCCCMMTSDIPGGFGMRQEHSWNSRISRRNGRSNVAVACFCGPVAYVIRAVACGLPAGSYRVSAQGRHTHDFMFFNSLAIIIDGWSVAAYRAFLRPPLTIPNHGKGDGLMGPERQAKDKKQHPVWTAKRSGGSLSTALPHPGLSPKERNQGGAKRKALHNGIDDCRPFLGNWHVK